jgi:hypothetical protein
VDLFRMEFILTYEPVPDSVILEIVDDVFLPLVNAGRTPNAISGTDLPQGDRF